MKPEARFTILQSVGRDELGEVSQAMENETGKLVALKVFDAWTMKSGDARANYRDAIQVMHAIGPARTPRPIAIHLAEESGWLATEWLSSDSLETFAKRLGRFAPEIAAGIACGLLDALQEFHDAGLPHGGLTPGKIHLMQGFMPGGVVVTDPFQHVLYGGESPLSRAQSGTGPYFGDPRYLSPEQARGDKPDIRSDIYAIGLILFEMLSGRAAFEGTPHEILQGHVNTDAPKIASTCDVAIPEDLEFIVGTALAKNPDARFQSPIAMRRALAHCRSAVDEDAERAAAPLGRSRGNDITALFMTKVEAVPAQDDMAAQQAAAAAAAAQAAAAQAAAAEAADKQAAEAAAKAAQEEAARNDAAQKEAAAAAAAEQAAAAAAAEAAKRDEEAATAAAATTAKSKNKNKKKKKGKSKDEPQVQAQESAASAVAFVNADEATAAWLAAGKNPEELIELHGEEKVPPLTEINKRYDRISAVILVGVTVLLLGGFLAMHFLGQKVTGEEAGDQKASQVTSQQLANQ